MAGTGTTELPLEKAGCLCQGAIPNSVSCIFGSQMLPQDNLQSESNLRLSRLMNLKSARRQSLSWLLLAAVLSLLVQRSSASLGDRLPDFRECVKVRMPQLGNFEVH